MRPTAGPAALRLLLSKPCHLLLLLLQILLPLLLLLLLDAAVQG
jgi:hypothetical protein